MGGEIEEESKSTPAVKERKVKRMWDQIRIVCLVQNRLDMLMH